MTEKLWVIYDGHCGFCVACRRWLETQHALVPLEFLPLSSPEVRRLFPELAIPEKVDEPIVISDQGAVYRGSSAWILCLWALEEYRDLAGRLASPAPVPLAARGLAAGHGRARRSRCGGCARGRSSSLFAFSGCCSWCSPDTDRAF